MNILKYIIIAFSFIISTSSNCQLSLEAIGGTSLNMSIKTQYVSNPNSPKSSTVTVFPGGSFDIGIGGRLKFNDKWSLGCAIEYQYKGNEANFERPPFYPENFKNSFHILVIPLDINYTFSNKIGIHFGAELATLLHPRVQTSSLSYQDKVMGAGLIGISYTLGRVRFELLYKHYFNYYMKQIAYLNIGQNEPLVEYTTLNRFHDVQLRIAVRLFSVN